MTIDLRLPLIVGAALLFFASTVAPLPAGEESVAVVSNFSSTFAEVIEEEVQVNQAIPQQQETQTQQQNPEQRKLAVDSDGTTFDFSRLFPFLPKTTGKGSWTPIKIWSGEEKRTSRADRVVSSATRIQTFSISAVCIVLTTVNIFLFSILLSH